MAEASAFLSTKRYAVVTGANKGIGLETSRQLASKGINVILTARDERRGTQAVEKLKESHHLIESNVEFHQLDVTNPTSIASLADFLCSKFGKLDILVNNAGVAGALVHEDAYNAYRAGEGHQGRGDFKKLFTQTYDSADQCFQTNYYGVKNITEALAPLLKLSDSARIVNVSSTMGQLKKIPGECIKTILSDLANLTEARIDELIDSFLGDVKEGSHAAKGWPSYLPAYTASKAVLNAYTRLLAKKYPFMLINCVCPGYVKTDINLNTGYLSAEQGAESVVRLALLPPKEKTSGLFFYRKEETPF